MLMRALFMLGLGATLATPVLSQHHGARHGPPDASPGPRAIPVEAALRHRQQLKLTEKQVTELTTLREAGVKARQQHSAAMMELSSRYRAGEISREEFQAQMRNQRQSAAPGVSQRGGQLSTLLDQTQQAALRELAREDRQTMRQGADRGGMRGGRGRPMR